MRFVDLFLYFFISLFCELYMRFVSDEKSSRRIKVEKSLVDERREPAAVRRSKYGVREYPIKVRAHAGVYSWIAGFTTANSPGHYANVDPSTVGELMQQRAARVALERERFIKPGCIFVSDKRNIRLNRFSIRRGTGLNNLLEKYDINAM